MILLDTNIIIRYLKGDPSVVAHVQSAPAAELAIPSVVAFELEYGTLRSKGTRRRTMVNRLFADSLLVPFDHAAAMEAAHVRVELESRGIMIGAMDSLIAGTALSRGALLVTANTKEFSRVHGLRLADWTI